MDAAEERKAKYEAEAAADKERFDQETAEAKTARRGRTAGVWVGWGLQRSADGGRFDEQVVMGRGSRPSACRLAGTRRRRRS